MKLIAKNESEVGEVIANLSKYEKLQRLRNLYSLEDVLEIIGYYDDSIEAESSDHIEKIFDMFPYDAELVTDIIMLVYGINNGNFEEAIARNKICLGL